MTTTATRKSQAEEQFEFLARDISSRYPNSHKIETTPATACFGEKIAISYWSRTGYLSYTLQRAGGYCSKRTALRSFGMVNGERATAQDAAMRIQFES
jgi:hypothetical protein